MSRFGFKPAVLHHGLQLAAAVLIGYAVAAALGLPERFWVVITVLIVMRADSRSTLNAGWDRVGGTLLGAFFGLAGVALQYLGANAIMVTLAIISVLAFGSAALPLLRSAAVAALIILAAGELPGYAAIQVALLRVLQIGIGVTVSVALAWATSRYSTRARLLAGCAALLGRLSLQLQTHGLGTAPTEAQLAARGTAVRTALQGLAALANSADQRFPWPRAKAAARHDRHHRRIAVLTSRVVQDTVTLNRVLALLRQQNQAHLAHQAADVVGAALASAARAMSGQGQPSVAALSLLAQSCSAPAGVGTAMLAAPLRLLLDDVNHLCGNGNGSAPGDASPKTVAPPAVQAG